MVSIWRRVELKSIEIFRFVEFKYSSKPFHILVCSVKYLWTVQRWQCEINRVEANSSQFRGL